MTVAEDASTPAAVASGQGVTTTAITTASFSPPAGSLLVVMAGVELSAAYSTTPSISISTTAAGVTFTQAVFRAEPTGKYTYAGIWYAYLSSAPGSITVKATRSEAGSGGMEMAVRVVTGAASSIGATAIVNNTGQSPSAQVSITPTKTGSQLYVVGSNDDSGSLTADAATTTISSLVDGTSIGEVYTGKATSLTSSTSAVTLGWTGNPSANDHQVVGAIEVVPAATGGTNYTASPADHEGLSDGLSLAQSFNRSPADHEGLSDGLSLAQSFNRSAADHGGLTDALSLTRSFSRSAADHEGLTDAVSTTLSNASSLSQSAADKLGLTDSVSAVLGHLNDHLGLTDAVSTALSGTRPRADKLGITDAITIVVVASGFGAEPFGTGPFGERSSAADLVDHERLTDAATVTQDLFRSPADKLGLTDSLSAVLGFAPRVTDHEGLTDRATTAISAPRSAADHLGLTDSVSAVLGYPNDHLRLTDAVTVDRITLSPTVLAYATLAGDGLVTATVQAAAAGMATVAEANGDALLLTDAPSTATLSWVEATAVIHET